MSTPFDIHVLGGAVGESIVIRTPSNRWGVIDCYSPDISLAKNNPTVDLLTNNGAKELAFLALTHPHGDHFRGMSHLVESFPILEFWRFGAFSPDDLENILTLAWAEANGAEEIENHQELEKLFEQLAKLQEKVIPIHLSDYKPLYSEPVRLEDGSETSFEIFGIAPSSAAVQLYQAELKRCFSFEGDQVLLVDGKLPHNSISAAFWVKYGNTQLVLGGDVETEGWEQVIRLCQKWNVDLRAQAVKVSHHGSTNGYAAGLWKLFCSDMPAHAIFTPYLRHGLPRQPAIDHISQHTRSLFTTSRSALKDIEFDVPNDYPAFVKLALRTSGQRVYRWTDARGVCSFSFDSNGPLDSVRFEGDAGPFPTTAE